MQQQCDATNIVKTDGALAPFADNIDPFEDSFDDVFGGDVLDDDVLDDGSTTEDENLLVSLLTLIVCVSYVARRPRPVLALIACACFVVGGRSYFLRQM